MESATSVEPMRLEEVAADPLPSELSDTRLRNGALVLVTVVAVVVAVVLLTPGLHSIRNAFSGARVGWLALAAVLQVGSCLSYVIVFRGVFCRLMSWRTSYQIGSSELATNSLFSVGGAGGLALGAWILRRGGVSAGHIARRTVAFFLLTSLVNVIALVVAGVGLATGVLGDAPNRLLLGALPAAIGLVGVALVASVRPLGAAMATRVRGRRLSGALSTLSEGVGEALMLLRRGDLKIIVGAAGYMLFDVAMLGVCFAAFGSDVPPVGILLMSYLIGQLGGLIPIPGGIGGVDGGLIGTLVLYGVGVTQATVAVLAYRALVLWIPLFLGVPAMLALKRRLREEEHDIAACAPGEEVELLGVGRVRATAEG